MTEPMTRRRLFSWLIWFGAANIAVLALVSLRYSIGAEPGTSPLAWTFVISTYISHLGLLSLSPMVLLVGALAVFLPRRRIVVFTAVAVMALVVALMTLDSLLWAQSRFHLNMLTVRILGVESWVFTAIMLVIAAVFESLLAKRVWDWTGKTHRVRGVWLIALLGTMFLLSQGIHAWANATYHEQVSRVTIQLPGFRGITAKGIFESLGLVDIELSRERAVAERLGQELSASTGHELNYPQQSLECTTPNPNPQNLLLVVIDSLRADMVSPQVTPGISALAENGGLQFKNHFSGGNSSRSGMFSIFYGLPPSYNDTIEALHQAPVLVTQLQTQGYEPAIFSSSSLYRATALERTAFASVADLNNEIGLSDQHHTRRVELINDAWLEWIAQRDSKQPFFAFLYYDSNRRPQAAAPLSASASEAQREFNDYKAAMRFNDGLLETVIDDLQARSLLDDTVVVVTGDHGEEFDELGNGIMGHGSSFTHYQLHVPMVIHWPGMEGAVITERTSHNDLVPTLMTRLLGCSNPPDHYSSGQDLLTRKSWKSLLVGSYYNYALLEPDQVTITFPNGNTEVRSNDYHLMPKTAIRINVLREALQENSRFYR